jgi:tetratricopeptide (TPR) repeat protein
MAVRVRNSLMSMHCLATLSLAFAIAATVQKPPATEEKPRWIGKRVLPKSGTLTLRVNDEPIERGAGAIDFYRVEQTDGPLVWLRAETLGVSGWADAKDVVPVDQALEFFSQQIRTVPAHAFPYAARALLERDLGAVDQALIDYGEAIRLDPRNASHRRGQGLVWQSKLELDKALADFSLAIELDPKSPLGYIARGASHASNRNYTKAIADYSEAIWLDPLAIAAYTSRGLAWHCKKEFQKAIIDYDVAIRLDPQHTVAYCNRGDAWFGLRRFDKALGDYEEAIRIDQRCMRAYGARAWIWAASRDARLRDGKKAVASATRACELTHFKDADLLTVLAAAYAEAGDYDSAVTWQTRANSIAATAATQARGAARLKLLQQKQPIRDTSD